MWNNEEGGVGQKMKLICQTMDLQEQVNDIQWSPSTSSCFAMVAEDGRIEIWDLKLNPLEPKLVYWDQTNDEQKIQDAKTVVRWSNESPVLVTGNNKGLVDVYRTQGLEHVQVTQTD